MVQTLQIFNILVLHEVSFFVNRYRNLKTNWLMANIITRIFWLADKDRGRLGSAQLRCGGNRSSCANDLPKERWTAAIRSQERLLFAEKTTVGRCKTSEMRSECPAVGHRLKLLQVIAATE